MERADGRGRIASKLARTIAPRVRRVARTALPRSSTRQSFEEPLTDICGGSGGRKKPTTVTECGSQRDQCTNSRLLLSV